LPVDKASFKGEIPDVKNLYPFTPFNLFIQRKLFMHNMSHALCAYLGFLRNYEYIYQTVADYDIKYVAFKALMASALAVSKENGVDIKVLIDHADNLLYRFRNTALGDTVARVGKDTKRKLSSNDRLIGALKLCEKHDVDGSYLCIGIAAGLIFNPDGDESSQELSAFANENGVKSTLEKYSEYNGKNVDLIANLYADLKAGKSLDDIVKKVEDVSNTTIRV
jgi:mannitol-1-phosphate 5-dehydrogenase